MYKSDARETPIYYYLWKWFVEEKMFKWQHNEMKMDFSCRLLVRWNIFAAQIINNLIGLNRIFNECAERV